MCNEQTRRSATLDRGLCSERWRRMFQSAAVQHLLHSHSNHCPLLIRQDQMRVVNWDAGHSEFCRPECHIGTCSDGPRTTGGGMGIWLSHSVALQRIYWLGIEIHSEISSKGKGDVCFNFVECSELWPGILLLCLQTLLTGSK